MEIIIGRQGTQKKPITDGTVSKRHCKVTKNSDGTFTVENLSNASYTKVDGKEIIRGRATLDSIIELGPNFRSSLRNLLGIPVSSGFSSSTGNSNQDSKHGIHQPPKLPKEVKTFNISHLKKIWEDHNQKNIEASEKQRKINLTRTGLGIFTMCAMPTIFFLGPIGYAITGIGVLGNIYSFAGMKNSETAFDRQKRQDEFDDSWVCPNPECGKTLPARNYKLLVKNHQSCPYCKCKYVER